MHLKVILLIAALGAALTGGGLAIATGGDGGSDGRPEDPLLRSGAARYEAYLRAEAASLRSAQRRGDRLAVRLHTGRLAPAGGRGHERVDPAAAVIAAARLLSLDARNLEKTHLLDVEARVAGAAVAFDAVRDALWARDRGLIGSIDERLAGLRAELDRHRRGAGFRDASSLPTQDRRRLAAALDAYAWRLSLAVDLVAA